MTADEYTCNRCFKKFSSRHYKIHLGLKEYRCLVPDCDCVFSRRDNMKTHYKSHLARLGMDAEEIKSLVTTIPKRHKRSISVYSVQSNSSDSPTISHSVPMVPATPLIPLCDSPLFSKEVLGAAIHQRLGDIGYLYDTCNHPMCCIHGKNKASFAGTFRNTLESMQHQMLLPSRSLTPDPSWTINL